MIGLPRMATASLGTLGRASEVDHCEEDEALDLVSKRHRSSVFPTKM
jgi:hypothetical protein